MLGIPGASVPAFHPAAVAREATIAEQKTALLSMGYTFFEKSQEDTGAAHWMSFIIPHKTSLSRTSRMHAAEIT
jgi:hypothetical protein